MRPQPALRRVAASGIALPLLVLATNAQAFCRGETEAGPDPSVTHECFEGGSGVYELYWQNRCVGYSLQKDASVQITLAQATPIVAQAFATWSAASCGSGAPTIQAVDEGPVDCSLVQYNSDGPNQHVIIFRDDAWPYDDPYNTLALTTITFDATDGEIFDADMEINSHDYTIVADPSAVVADASPPTYDLLSIVTHEAGHFLGLAHSTDASAVMFTFYRPGSTQLTADDVAGVCSIYPPDGTRSTSFGPVDASACDPTPRHGFTTECNGVADDAGIAADAGIATAVPTASNNSCSLGLGTGARSAFGVVAVLTALVGLLARRRPAGFTSTRMGAKIPGRFPQPSSDEQSGPSRRQ